MKRIALAFAALAVAVWMGVWWWARLPSYTPLTPDERAQAMAYLRGALAGKSGPVPSLSRAIAGPVLVTVWDQANVVTRAIGRGPTLGEALHQAALLLPEDAPRGRIKLDVVLARAPMWTGFAPLFALALEPGRDGIGLELGEKEAWITADELLRADVLASHPALSGMDFTIGTDTGAVVRMLADRVGARAGEWASSKRRFFRFRADESIESPSEPGRALVALRGNVLRDDSEPTAARLRAAAEKGGRYLLRHVDAGGQFDYEYFPMGDQVSHGDYSIPRHSGGIWFLAQMFAHTHDPAYVEAAKRAIGWLERAVPPGCDGERSCIGDDPRLVDLGSTALTLISLIEYRQATGDHSRDDWMRRLFEFVLFMQQPNGDFCHLYKPGSGERDEQTHLLYYSGEATFALSKLLTIDVLDEKARARARDGLDRGLHWLTDTQYATLAGQFFFLEDHWTCMSVDAGWSELDPARREPYARFCDQFIAFLGRTQFKEGDAIVASQPDFLGAYGFSPFLPPHGTPVGSRSETTLSTLSLQKRRGLPARVTDVTRAQIVRGMRFLLAHQLDDDSSWLAADPEKTRGGFYMSDVARRIRVDFVQHACSAMLRAASLFEK
jgi:hypothetical protein